MSPQPAARRRGNALTEAIYLATLEELARTSFAELSFEKIAAAAGTGKAALYRRWSTAEELVLAALTDPATGFGQPLAPPRTGALRTDLVRLLTDFLHILDQPRGRALRPLIAFRHQHPGLFDQVWATVIRPAQRVFLNVFQEAADRGEANPARISGRTAALGPRTLLIEAWSTDRIGDGEVTAVVDEILIPLLSGR